MSSAGASLLAVEQLCCHAGSFRLGPLGFALRSAERVALWGPSGSGKSLLLRVLLGLLPRGVTAEGTLVVDGRARSLADPRALSALRGSAVGLVPQAAVESLDPVRRIDRQLREIVARHRTARSPAELAARVGLPTAALALHPAGLSGGMAQKAALALALAAGPRVLLCDEPTASLDNVAQAEVLDLLAQTCAREQAALLLVSHDLGLLARVCDRVLVLIDGQLVHDAGIPEVLASSDPGVRRLVLAGRAARARLGGGGR